MFKWLRSHKLEHIEERLERLEKELAYLIKQKDTNPPVMGGKRKG